MCEASLGHGVEPVTHDGTSYMLLACSEWGTITRRWHRQPRLADAIDAYLCGPQRRLDAFCRHVGELRVMEAAVANRAQLLYDQGMVSVTSLTGACGRR